jgi:holliday junction DNA helicase RuvA
MIAKLKGKIDYLQEKFVVLDIAGIGYKVFVTPYTSGKIAGKEELELFTHTHLREDSLDLYGFLSLEELEMFELLLSITGVGPKAGLGILTVATPKTIRTAVLNEDASLLTKVSGIGKKTAERIILELGNKIADLSQGEKDEAVLDSDAIEALLGMGYSMVEAREVLKSAPKEIKDVGERIKWALRNLGKNN